MNNCITLMILHFIHMYYYREWPTGVVGDADTIWG